MSTTTNPLTDHGAAGERTILGHPRGLLILFLTVM